MDINFFPPLPNIVGGVTVSLISMIVVNTIGQPVYRAIDSRVPELGEFRNRVEQVTGDVLDSSGIFNQTCKPNQ